MSDIEECVSGLSDFRTRSETIRRLAVMDPPPIKSLIEALRDPHEGVRYGAVRALGQVGASEACEALIEAAGEPALCSAAFKALRSITGEEHGADINKWRRALGVAAPDAAPSTIDQETGLEAVVQAAAADDDVDIITTKWGWLLTVSLPNGRSQKVSVVTTSSDRDGDQLLVMFTQCGPADPARYEWALKQNMKIPYGSLGIREIDGNKVFVMVDTQLGRTAQADEIRKSVSELAQRADRMEEALTGADEY